MKPKTKYDKVGTCSPTISKPSPNGPGGKLLQIRKEVLAQANRLRTKTSSKGSFADAVAFASGSLKGKEHRTKVTSTIILRGNKRMKIPTQVVKGAGPRQFASKYKT